MSEIKIIVDHLRMDFKGMFNANDLFRAIDSWLFEKGFEKRTNKNFEYDTASGKFMEWESYPWKKVTDYYRQMMKIRILIYDMVKKDVVHEGKKERLDHGRGIIYLDGYLELDYEHRWDGNAFLQAVRTLFDKWLYVHYTESFEKMVTRDCHMLNDHLEKLLNLKRHWRLVESVPA